MPTQKEIGNFNNPFPPSQEFDSQSKLWITTFETPLAFHVYTERFVNKGAYHSYRHNSEVTQKYRPVDGDTSFQVPFILVPRTEVRLDQHNPSDYLTKWLEREDQIPFFIHPDMLDTYQQQGITKFAADQIQGTLEAIPTASTRTLMVNMDGTLTMFKVDLSGKVLGRLTRQLPERSGVRSNIVAKLMDDAKDRGALPEKLGYFPETLSIGLNTGGNSYANIHREYTPAPQPADGSLIMPFFALYSPDLRNPGSTLIVQQLIEMSGKTPEVFFETEIAKPFIKNALQMAFKEGVLLEAHPQNSLVELNSQFGISRFLYRDLQTAIIDTDQRAQNGLSTDFPAEAKIIGTWQDDLDYKLDYSSFYDHRIAYQTLEEVIIAIAAKYPCSLTELQRRMQRSFKEIEESIAAIEIIKGFYDYFLGLLKNKLSFPDFY